MSARSWLGPPSRIKSENCSERSTGRPRPIPHDGSTRSTTRSQGRMSWSVRGSWCAPTKARPASMNRPSPTSSSYGVSRLLDELAADLRDGRWRPLPARRVFIPKPGREGEQRPLSIPAVRDRVVQAATKIVIEPIFEADFLPCSFGFRPKRSQHDALQVLIDESRRGRRWVLESDIANCFEAIPHSGLMSAIEERVSRPQPAEAPACDVARGGDGRWCGPPRGDRHSPGRCCFARSVQRLSASARPAVGRARDRGAGALRG